MPKTALRFIALAALFATPVLGFAQARTAPGPATAAPQSQPAASTPPATTGAASNTNATAPATPVTAGLTVKDNTGLAIGQIAEVKPDASGKSMATIKMGANAFQVPAANLAVENGAATINLTKAQIDAQLPKK
ncbi:MAG TPA: hypothetical protein VGH15_06770 [Caulobacteraceae bacterium]|jgi:hypothetical protein